ncbi:putative trans-sialidase [Trypanosoma cruzi]|uniref:Trans-sialidase, putative n=2 Tax=Trypanosoma cruzi TaxID=5693 RepID=Q4CUZ0_TRYCC|nr:trans-sialidase, putative [Trypanosoma cruzi]EAN84092.1 trans-sialidase, putative [Trypanosoma cruzi]PWV18530.1 putative trans-sialidase [Trypanosoma cruzi]|eukprot:XP_805943.1 trans-sialidase [Trypanosoma cruzi strain CL Brener]
MPSISRRVFDPAVLLLLFVMVCCGSGAAPAEASNSGKKIIFQVSESFSDSMNATLVQAFHSFRAPSLVYVDGVVVATVEAHYTNSTDQKSCVSIAAKSMKSNGGTWTDGTAIVFDHYDVKIDRLLSPTTIVDGNGYETNALVGGYGTSTTPLTEVADGDYWMPRMADGVVPHYGDDEEKKQFEWQNRSTSKVPYDFWDDTSTKPKPFKQFLGGGGAGIRMEDESRYVLPIQALTRDGKNVSLVILANSTYYSWKFSKHTSDEGCIQPAVLEWKEKNLIMMTSCDDGSRRVYRSSSMGNLWTEEYDTLSRVWGNSRNRTGHGVQGGFISATIDEQKFILVSRPVYSGEAGKETGRLHLWLTDMQRIYDVGPISAENENVAASTLLYATVEAPSLEEEEKKEEKKLYCSYEVAAGGDKYNIAFVDLTEKLEEMKKVVAAWKEKDAYIAREYGCRNEKNNWRSDCGEALAEGLVGFLSNTSTDSTWADEYLCVNATITKGTKGKVASTENCVTFEGSGAGAEWPVGKMGQNVPYHFANDKFTLVATVSIHKEPKGSSSIPLMGVRMNDARGTVLFGLSYTHEKKWEVTFSDGLRKPLAHDDGAGWETNKKYQVTLHMDYNDGVSVYVDGEEIYYTKDYEDGEDYNFTQKLRTLLGSHGISHFYIGGDTKNNSDDINVTVSNVLLYNRALNEAKLKALMKRNAVAAAAAKVPAQEVAAQTTNVSEPSRHPAIAPVVTPEAQQDATSSPRSQHTPAQKSESKSGPVISKQTSSDVIVPPTSADMEKVEEESPDSGALAPASTPTQSAGSRELLGTEMPVSGEHFPPSMASPLMGQVDKADEDSPRNGNTDDRAPHSISPDVLESVGTNSGPDSFISTNVSGGADRDEDTHAHTAVGTNSSTDPATAHRNGNVSGGADAAQTSSSTAPGETKIPSEFNATIPLDNVILLEHGQFGDLAAMALIGDSTVHGCVSGVLLLLLGLWGTAALC